MSAKRPVSCKPARPIDAGAVNVRRSTRIPAETAGIRGRQGRAMVIGNAGPNKNKKKIRQGRALASRPLGPLFPDAPPDPGQPAWAPSRAEAEKIPAAVRQNLYDLILPMYQQLVLEVEDPLERSINATLVHLAWLETLDQHYLKRRYMNIELILDIDAPRHEEMNRLLSVLNSKMRASVVMSRIREVRNQAAQRQTQAAANTPTVIAHDVPAAPATTSLSPPQPSNDQRSVV
jgi:hypothetical protein